MNRRNFLHRASLLVSTLAIDPAELIWRPTKAFSFPSPQRQIFDPLDLDPSLNAWLEYWTKHQWWYRVDNHGVQHLYVDDRPRTAADFIESEIIVPMTSYKVSIQAPSKPLTPSTRRR